MNSILNNVVRLLTVLLGACLCCGNLLAQTPTSKAADKSAQRKPAQSKPAQNKPVEKASGKAVDLDAATLRRRQEAQERARTQARELLESIVDIQIQQLTENGLTDAPIFGELKQMRSNIAGLVDREMADVVKELITAQTAAAAQRDTHFRAARSLTREVVLRLAAERQNLLRRLRAAELVAQTERVITRQTAVRESTVSLPSLPQLERDKAALLAGEDQTDVKQLFIQLVDSLAEVSRWDGPTADAALRGLQVLQAESVGSKLDAVDTQFTSAEFAAASNGQTQVIDGLVKLKTVLESLNKSTDRQRDELTDQVNDLVNTQQQLRNQAEAATPESLSELVDPQAELAQQLSEMAAAMDPSSELRPLVESAKTAAEEAAAEMFAGQQETVASAQDRVLASLAELQQRVSDATPMDRTERSAEQLARRISDLEAAARDIAAIQQSQAAASKQPEAAAAASQERDIAAKLPTVSQNRDLPNNVGLRLASAQDAAQTAANSLASQPPDAKARSEQAADAVQRADAAVERAAAEINTALADTKRRALAVKAGELARAAEVLERAAAAERMAAQELTSSTDKQKTDPNASNTPAQTNPAASRTAAELTAEQQRIADVAAKTQAALKPLASSADQDLTAAQQSANEATAQLQQASDASQPAAKSMSAEARSATAEKMTAAADKLSSAAAALRQDLRKAANALAEETARQQPPVAAARDAAEAFAELSAATGKPTRDQAASQADALDRMTTETAAVDAAATSALREAEHTARDLAAGKSNPNKSNPSDTPSLENLARRAAASLASREQRLERDAELARRLAAQAERQQAASDRIAELRNQPNGAARAAAEAMNPELADAVREFARAQRSAGQSAQQASGQRSVMNPPLRDALQLASQLGSPPTPTPSNAEQTPAGHLPNAADGNAAIPQTRPDGAESPNSDPNTSSSNGLPSDGSPNSGAKAGDQEAPPPGANPAGESPDGSTPGQTPGQTPGGQPGESNGNTVADALQKGMNTLTGPRGNPNGSPVNRSMGTGLVPNSPETTAAMMAGRDPNDFVPGTEAGSGDAEAGESQEDSEGMSEGAGEEGSSESQGREGQGDGQQSDGGEEGKSGQGEDTDAKAADFAAGKGNQPGKKPGKQANGKSDSTGDVRGEQATENPDRDGSTSTLPDANAPAETVKGNRTGDSQSNGRRDATAEPWFARLPPEVRAAIRARSNRPPPRSYEDRLKKYFEKSP